MGLYNYVRDRTRPCKVLVSSWLAPQVRAVLSMMARLTIRLLSLMTQRLVALSRRTVSTLIARVLTGFASILSGAAVLAQPVPPVTDAPVMPRLEAQPIDASEVIAAIQTQMLSPLVNTVVPVHNLDGSIDESSPGIEHFYWVDGPSDRSYWGDEPTTRRCGRTRSWMGTRCVCQKSTRPSSSATTGRPRSRTARTSRPRLYALKSTESNTAAAASSQDGARDA